MGSVYAALLASAGNDVVVVDAWDEHVAAIRAHGLRVEGASGDRVVELEAQTDTAGIGPVELVVIATKATDVRDAAAAADRSSATTPSCSRSRTASARRTRSRRSSVRTSS